MGVKKEITQTERILRHLQDFGKISSWEAIREYGITRLSAKIYDIKKMGYEIKTEWYFIKNRYGEPVHFKKYSLVKKHEPSLWDRLRGFV